MQPVPRWFTFICWVLAVLFAVFVALQLNDPDPIRWMVIYGAAALSCALLPARKRVAVLAVVVGLIAAAWGAYIGSQVFGQVAISDLWLKMSEKGGAVEVGRETGGLAIVAVAMFATAAFRATRS